ncbi:MAG TPA: TerC/Alx family metal homeostasis membrane protein [Candidatus Kapabacteria bacterium]|nr:TerC/Alx family metal homeostasis membrane protein [Candidatus Kapabacteria bacterium]
MTFQRALAWSIFWIGLSMLVALGIYAYWGIVPAEAFLTGYAIEKALSVDNLFIFLMLFTYFGVKREAQRRSLNYGLIGVLVLRGILIFAGIALVRRFEWVMYVLGAVVIYTGFMMALGGEKEFDPGKSRIVKIVSKFVRVSPAYHGNRFFVREAGRKIATPLFLVLCVIEVMDVLFAVDSIPAIFAVTRDPFIIYSSNILAVLGLRSLYFLLERAHDAFRFVKQGVGLILWFIGAKMILPAFWPAAMISNTVALAVVIVVLLVAIVLSVTIKKSHVTE